MLMVTSASIMNASDAWLITMDAPMKSFVARVVVSQLVNRRDRLQANVQHVISTALEPLTVVVCVLASVEVVQPVLVTRFA